MKEFAGERPEIIDRGLCAAVALVGAIAEPDHPLRGVPQMVGAFLLGLRGNRRQRLILGFHHRAPIQIGKRRVEKLPHNSAGEITVWLFDQQKVAILPDVAQISVLIFVVARVFDLGGIGVEFACLPDQVEAHIGERHVLFHHGRMAAPFRQAMPEDQRIVSPAQHVKHQRTLSDLDRCDRHHICPTSSGTS